MKSILNNSIRTSEYHSWFGGCVFLANVIFGISKKLRLPSFNNIGYSVPLQVSADPILLNKLLGSTHPYS
jgi:hypothetical protein